MSHLFGQALDLRVWSLCIGEGRPRCKGWGPAVCPLPSVREMSVIREPSCIRSVLGRIAVGALSDIGATGKDSGKGPDCVTDGFTGPKTRQRAISNFIHVPIADPVRHGGVAPPDSRVSSGSTSRKGHLHLATPFRILRRLRPVTGPARTGLDNNFRFDNLLGYEVKAKVPPCLGLSSKNRSLKCLLSLKPLLPFALLALLPAVQRNQRSMSSRLWPSLHRPSTNCISGWAVTSIRSLCRAQPEAGTC
jgi:hypothetical protein